MDAAVLSLLAELHDATRALAAGLLTPGEWAEEAATHLEAAHTQAVVLGRQRAGDLTAEEEDDRTYAAQVMEGQGEYLDGFREAIEDDDPRYLDGKDFRVGPIMSRLELYALATVGTANEAFALTSGEDLITWNLGAVEHSCPQCPELADGSPYKASELPTVPCGGGTQCGSRCGCYLTREDGVAGFNAPDLSEVDYDE